MSIQTKTFAPEQSAKQQALSIFLGSWKAEGQSYGSPNQSNTDPKANSDHWTSSHIAEWHSGKFFLFQSETAFIGRERKNFDTLSVLGVDEKSGAYFVRTFDNLGYHRDYAMTGDGKFWRLKGETERALIEFSDDGATQTIHWEWRPHGEWLPLCDRVATKIEI